MLFKVHASRLLNPLTRVSISSINVQIVVNLVCFHLKKALTCFHEEFQVLYIGNCVQYMPCFVLHP